MPENNKDLKATTLEASKNNLDEIQDSNDKQNAGIKTAFKQFFK